MLCFSVSCLPLAAAPMMNNERRFPPAVVEPKVAFSQINEYVTVLQNRLDS